MDRIDAMNGSNDYRGEVSFIAGVQVGEVGAEKPLERTCVALAVGSGQRRIQGQGH
jgi:hypothetical protein